MKKKKWTWTVGVILLVLLLIVGFRCFSPTFSAQNLTAEEAKTAVLEKYPGDIVKTTKNEDEYQIEMRLETGLYIIKIDAKTGDVLSLERLQKGENSSKEEPQTKLQLSQKEIEEKLTTQGELQSIEMIQKNDNYYYEAIVTKDNEKLKLKVDPFTGEILDSMVLPTPTITENTVITVQEAIVIAANHLKGKADDDVTFHQPSGSPPYYLVEVELENGEDDREATVQVDAYTGEVKSVNWDE
ncbi:PepSY domain-containing protein [Psychrobacillus sp. FSL H8-0484]|uniref:PepSY domain-containing protein n=1 Tax=Psychrobacillus sp. FSL H8-0484 TaxID=2921390 RepID=UPI0030F7B7D0